MVSTDPPDECLKSVIVNRGAEPAVVPTMAELFAAHYAGLVRLAGLLGADDPEDLAQEAFARLHRRRGMLKDPHKALPYLRSTVCNLARNRFRHLRIARLNAPPPPDHHMAAEESAIRGESRRELWEALGTLAVRQREALVLRYWLDLSVQEIAAAMGVSTGTVKVHTSRGLDALNRILKERQP
ncbi:SigE family RNA polymerase sigma factor [Actinomadura barringtoniae]|uniref:SigE family RNA polymerase sigma factor n=2 Tax=Actinomadura barringtoniae TaxID=1427535 RepID=A0A939PDH1_9ACTN|nr:SigE family RNA polymerase sigma factor [Actinomadura barringtoniae]